MAKRIFLVDDNSLVRHQLRALLESGGDWKVCGEAENGLEAVEKAPIFRPDVIVVDFAMPVMNGLEATAKLSRLLPDSLIVMFSMFADPQVEKLATDAGASAIFSKSESVQSLIAYLAHLSHADDSGNSAESDHNLPIGKAGD